MPVNMNGTINNSLNGAGAGPPPSTLAAQIVENIQHSRPRRERTDDLQNLLDEFLKAGPDAFAGTDLPTRYQLVDVLLKACVQNLDNVGPFDDLDAINKQSVQVLEVVESTIRQSSDLLLFSPDATSPATNPFFLSLIPRLLHFIGDRYVESVAEAGSAAIRACMYGENKGGFLKSVIKPVTQYIRKTTQEVLRSLNQARPVLFPTPSDPTLLAAWRGADTQHATGARIPEPSVTWLCCVAARLLPLGLPDATGSRRSAMRMDATVFKDLACLTQVLRRRQTTLRNSLRHEGLYMHLLRTARRFWHMPMSKIVRRQVLPVIVPSVCDLLQQILNISPRSLSDSSSREICLTLSCLLKEHAFNEQDRTMLSESFAAHLQNLLDEPGDWSSASIDLRVSFALVGSIILERELDEPFASYIDQIQDTELSNELSKSTQHLKSDETAGQSSASRPRKRLRMTKDNDESDQTNPRAKFIAMMTERQIPSPNTTNLPAGLWKRLPADNEQGQDQLLRAMGAAICNVDHSDCEGACPRCDNDYLDRLDCEAGDQSFFDYCCSILTNMVTVQADQSAAQLLVKGPLSRTISLSVLNRLLSHSTNTTHFNLEKSSLGQWCSQCLSSKTREVRTMAGIAIRQYVSFKGDAEVSRRNRVLTLDTLRVLSEKDNVQEHETCIWALGQLANLHIEHVEMNIILLRLVDYLRHPSPLVSGLAYDELLRLSNHEAATAKKLLEPYWSTIAPQIVGDLTTRPSAVQRLCDILGISVAFFQSYTRLHTVPHLVLTKKRDVLERIASATIRPDQKPSTVAQLCLTNDQLPSLLARILMEPSPDLASLIHNLLCHASPDFAEMDVFDLLKIDQAPIAFEIFQRAGEPGEDLTKRARNAIAFLAENSHNRRQSSSARRSTRRSTDGTQQAMHTFFETHDLAIMKSLSDIVTEVERPQALPDRRRSLIGLRQMIAVGGDSLSLASTQLSACLRSTMSNPDLCEDGFEAWALMMRSFEDITSLIEPTFALIERNWEIFSPAARQTALDLVRWIFAEQNDYMRDFITELPSLGDIPLLSKFESDIVKFKAQLDQKHAIATFAARLGPGDPDVTLRTLEELETWLESNAGFIQQSSQSEQPEIVVGKIMQVLLDTCVRHANVDREIAHGCARCLGLIGCLDPSRIEMHRDRREIVVLSNFVDRNETVDFVVFFLQEVIVPSFVSNMNTRSQNFLGFAMQELLQICNFKFSSTMQGVEDTDTYRKWEKMSEESKSVLKPFMNSRYTLKEGNPGSDMGYPIFAPAKAHDEWLRQLCFDLLRKAHGENAAMVFSICKRIVRGQDITIASFLLPYVVLNILISDQANYRGELAIEFMQVLGVSIGDKPQSVRDNVILCSQTIFRTFDYLSKWMHKKRSFLAKYRIGPEERQNAEHSIQIVQTLLDGTPAEIMANRAVECRNYSRALFYWEQYMRQWLLDNAEQLQVEPQASDFLHTKLQSIYVAIDEPDGIEGASANIHLFDINQQVMEHRKAGRWTAVQNWSEIQLSYEPDNEEAQIALLSSIRESGQYDVLLKEFAVLEMSPSAKLTCKPFAIEACWETENWEKLKAHVPRQYADMRGDFTSGVGSALCALNEDNYDTFERSMETLRVKLAQGLSKSSVANLQTCRQTLLQLHALREIEVIADVRSIAEEPSPGLMTNLDLRLNAIGAFSSDKQWVLGLRRAAMRLSALEFSDLHLASAWLQSARLSRKQGKMSQALKSILEAETLKDKTAKIEHARLLWKEGNHRKAIQSLDGAIKSHAFAQHSTSLIDDSMAQTADPQKLQNILEAKAKLLHARWIDQAGETQSEAIIKRYQNACQLHSRWEKGQYYLGRHYDKILESERLKPASKMAQTVLTGELSKHVIENYIRGMAWGARYVYQTLPRCLTLWCEMGSMVDQTPEAKYGTDEVFRQHIVKNRKKIFEMTQAQLKKYIDRLPAWIFYTALNQVCARICHPNVKVYQTLSEIVTKVCVTHPQQSLWALLAMIRSTQRDRMQRGQQCLAKIQDSAKRAKSPDAAANITNYIRQGTSATEQLVNLCNADLKQFSRGQKYLKLRDLGFIQKQASPCKLVVPVQSTLALSLPPVADSVSTRNHKAFSKDVVTIQTFLDDVLLMSSLQRPRKVDIRGSDGRVYGLLCKPKDDLRLDQRLLEFNAMIQRSLKKDAECSKRRLYVKTYAVTPLNEECGLIEWVDGLKTHRDILVQLYKDHGIHPNYNEITALLDVACKGDLSKFDNDVMGMFPDVFHEWFTETFTEPEAWYNARLRYTRSAAVMSIVGHALGLGDRHSENIMIEEGNGGVMHVDFNCLFDKGQTFEKPERVPFRLTSNMISAFGATGYEGPFRKACELTMAILRHNEDTFMTILEQFVHDPTIDLMSNRKKKHSDVANTPEGVLEQVRNKLRGLLPKESVPLSVEGYVEHLILQARDSFNLASMYIGWCAFF